MVTLYARSARSKALLLLALWLILASGCTSEDAAGQGSLRIQAGGGKALQVGFPHSEGATQYAFVDGWALEFTRYVIVIGGLRLSDPETDTERGSWEGPAILDLRTDSGLNHEVVTLEGLPARRLDLEFRLLPASEKAENRNADPDVVEAMIAGGYSAWIEGEATRNGERVEFLFRLSSPARYFDCINGKDQTKGVAIEANKTLGVYIYAHALHLFWDTLAAGDETLRFDPFAAVAGLDEPSDLVTETELARQDLTDLRDADGGPLRGPDGKRIFYNDGGLLPPDDLTLERFVEYALRYSVHFNGVGLCVSEPLGL